MTYGIRAPDAIAFYLAEGNRYTNDLSRALIFETKEEADAYKERYEPETGGLEVVEFPDPDTTYKLEVRLYEYNNYAPIPGVYATILAAKAAGELWQVDQPATASFIVTPT